MTRFRANITFFSSSSSKLWEISFSSRSILLSFYIFEICLSWSKSLSNDSVSTLDFFSRFDSIESQ